MAVEAMRRGADYFLTKPGWIEGTRGLPRKVPPDRQPASVQPGPAREAPHDHALLRAVRGLAGHHPPHRGCVQAQDQRPHPRRDGHGEGSPGPLYPRQLLEWHGALRGAQLHRPQRRVPRDRALRLHQGGLTGAGDAKEGLIERAHRGRSSSTRSATWTLVLQAEVPEGPRGERFRPLGRVEEKVSDFRLISATNQLFENRITTGDFHKDLFFRINTLVIASHRSANGRTTFPGWPATSSGSSRDTGKEPALSPEVLGSLAFYDWPGNARELHNVLERAWVLADGKEIRPTTSPISRRSAGTRGSRGDPGPGPRRRREEPDHQGAEAGPGEGPRGGEDLGRLPPHALPQDLPAPDRPEGDAVEGLGPSQVKVLLSRSCAGLGQFLAFNAGPLGACVHRGESDRRPHRRGTARVSRGRGLSR